MSDIPSLTFAELMNNKEHTFDLFLTLIFSTISVILIILLPDGNPIRIAASLPLLVFFPGYVLVAFLWPEGYGKKEYSGDLKVGTTEVPKEKPVKNYERTILSIGLSLLITPAIASDPYCAAAPSRRTSIVLIAAAGMAFISVPAVPRPTELLM